MQWLSRFFDGILSPASTVFLLFSGILLTLFLRPWRTLRRAASGLSARSSRSALLTALGGTIGVGNISGVALALSCGGPGALFWMWVSSIVAMSVKYTEILLACHYRISRNGGYHGGAPLYISALIGRIPAAIFSALCMLTAMSVGSGVQTAAVADAFEDAFSVPKAVTGIFLTAAAAVCILGGTKRITRFTDKLVPLMTLIYTALSLYIIITDRAGLPAVMKAIFQGAFKPGAARGGIIGVLTGGAVRYGISRGLVSNEAGCGTAPFAHATAEGKHPAEQAAFGFIEVFVDTMLLCSLTGISMLLAFGGEVLADGSGMECVMAAFGFYFGEAAPALLALSVLLFAYGSIICWDFYGSECLLLRGASKKRQQAFLIVFLASVFLGSVVDREVIWFFSDASCCLMLLCYLPALLSGMKTARSLTEEYISRK